jgi:hypothetical protein
MKLQQAMADIHQVVSNTVLVVVAAVDIVVGSVVVSDIAVVVVVPVATFVVLF